jgi:hypothetical protein
MNTEQLLFLDVIAGLDFRFWRICDNILIYKRRWTTQQLKLQKSENIYLQDSSVKLLLHLYLQLCRYIFIYSAMYFLPYVQYNLAGDSWDKCHNFFRFVSFHTPFCILCPCLSFAGHKIPYCHHKTKSCDSCPNVTHKLCPYQYHQIYLEKINFCY